MNFYKDIVICCLSHFKAR